MLWNFAVKSMKKELEQLDVDDCLLKMKNAEERGAVFANLLNDYKKSSTIGRNERISIYAGFDVYESFRVYRRIV